MKFRSGKRRPFAGKTFLTAALAAGLLAACGEDDVILPGERLDLRATQAVANQTSAVGLPAAEVNRSWTHRNGDTDHLITHPALGASLAPLFTADIGEGDSRGARITADPVVANGVIYTLDARATVTATSAGGGAIWSRDLTPRRDGRSDASGGGLAYAAGRVYVTSGFGEVSVLDAATGAVIWQQDLDAPAIAAPTVRGDLVYVVARNSTAWALDTANGRIMWQLAGTPSVANFASSAAPAVNGDIAVFPFPSGEVTAAFPQGGLQRWSAAITGDRLGQAAAIVTDIAGDPVIAGNRVFVGNFGGRVVALALADGERLWTATEGAVGGLWLAGNSVFLVNDVNQLVRLDQASGAPVWRVPLPLRADDRSAARQRSVVAHYGPVLAGGRLIVASSDGLIRQFDPASGALVGTLPIPGGAASSPVVADRTLYVVSKSGQLHAFR